MCFGSRGFTSHFKRYQLDPHDAHDITRNNERMFVGHFFVGKSIKRHSQVLNVQRGGGSYTQAADYWRQRSERETSGSSSDVFPRGFWQPCDLAFIYEK